MRFALLTASILLVACADKPTEPTDGKGPSSPQEESGDGAISGPYADSAANLIYQLLFCDRPDLFKANYSGDAAPPWSVLFQDPPEVGALAGIAADPQQESRVRMLAYNALRDAGQAVARKEHLGTILEAGFADGVDTLAVFVDGGARYINRTGKMAIVEGGSNEFRAEIDAVIAASATIVAAIGPWDSDRRPAPQADNIRMSFLVSDGLYFGEGPMDAMQQEAMAAPLINAATALLVKLVDRTTGGG